MNMNYTKPELVVISRAVEAVENSDIKPGIGLDANQPALGSVAPAYDAEE
jgi:hypothetical protein